MSIRDLGTALDDRFMQRVAAVFPAARYAMLHAPKDDRPFLSEKEWLDRFGDAKPDTAAVEVELAKQLGQKWTSFDDLPPTRRFGLLLLENHAAGKSIRDVIEDANQLALSGGEIDFSTLIPFLEIQVPAEDGAILTSAREHRYSECVALAVVSRAKLAHGVLQNAHFLWLKKHDRALWLLLDGIGRRFVPIEVAAVFAQADAEANIQKILGKPELAALASSLIA